MTLNLGRVFRRWWAPSAIGAAALALVTVICVQLHAIASVAALLYMIIVVLISLQGRFVPAIFVSLVAIGCLDYCFVKPGARIAWTGPLDLAGLVPYLTIAFPFTTLLTKTPNLS